MINSSEVCAICGYNKFSHDVLEGLNHKFKPQSPQKTNTPLEDTNITEMATGSSVSKSRMDFTNKTSKGDNTQIPPTLKDLEYYSYIKSEFLVRSKDVKESLKRLRDVLISRMCRPNKSLNTFENAREQEEIIKEEFDEIMGVWQDE